MPKNKKGKNFAMELKNRINQDIYFFGSRIPSERTLAEQSKLSRATVREAIQELIFEGYLKNIQGKGTFVIKNVNEKLRINFKGMSELLKNAGFNPSNSIVAAEKCKAGYKLSRVFGIEETADVYRIIRLRCGNEQPISIEDTYLPYYVIPNIESIDFQIFSLYDILAYHSVQINHINHIFSTAKVRNNEAKLLQLNDGESVISLRLSAYTDSDTVIEYTRVLAVSSFCGFYTDCYIQDGEVKVYAQSD